MGDSSSCWQPPSQCSPGHHWPPLPCLSHCLVLVLSPGPARSFCRAALHTLGLRVCCCLGLFLLRDWPWHFHSLNVQRFLPFPVCQVPLQHQPCSEPGTPPSFVCLWRCWGCAPSTLGDVELGGAQCQALGSPTGGCLQIRATNHCPPQPWHFRQFSTHLLPSCLP